MVKIAAYQALPNCFDRTDSDKKGQWRAYFQNDNPLILELGCGRAEFSYELAKRYPTHNYIGIDLKPDRMWYSARQAIAEGVSNIAFLQINLLELADYFGENEASEIWITFPDPFPKKKQAKHRMINPNFLALYQKVLQAQGMMNFKTDNLDLFHYSLQVFVDQPNIQLKQLSFDLHEDERIQADVKIHTTYEKRFMELGEKIKYVSWQFV